ncbi:MAG: hypothetical protein R6V01_00990 [Thermoplasmatota archaeon]
MNLLLYLGPEERSFTDEDVSEGTYYYSVHAYNKQGMGEPAYDEVDVPARIPTAVIIGILAFLIPLIIGILAVVIPLLSARSKKKKEKLSREAPERTEEEKRKEQSMKAAVPGLPGTMQQRSGAPQLGQPRQAPIERVLPPAQHQYQQQQPAQQQPIAQQPFQQQYPRQQPVHQASPGEATATPSQPQMRAAPPLDMERLMDEKDARDKGETTEQKNMDPRGQR